MFALLVNISLCELMLPTLQLGAHGCTSAIESGDKKYSELNLVRLCQMIYIFTYSVQTCISHTLASPGYYQFSMTLEAKPNVQNRSGPGHLGSSGTQLGRVQHPVLLVSLFLPSGCFLASLRAPRTAFIIA